MVLHDWGNIPLVIDVGREAWALPASFSGPDFSVQSCAPHCRSSRSWSRCQAKGCGVHEGETIGWELIKAGSEEILILTAGAQIFARKVSHALQRKECKSSSLLVFRTASPAQMREFLLRFRATLTTGDATHAAHGELRLRTFSDLIN